MNKINPDAPAFPSMGDVRHHVEFVTEPGLSIRAELAARFMAALMGSADMNGEWTSVGKGAIENAAKHSVQAADVLISELNRGE